MTPRRRGFRTQACTAADARKRQVQARRFLEVAALVADEHDPNQEYAGIAAALAVLAGIAAADAACCKELGERSRSENHHDAEVLLGLVPGGGSNAVADLRRLVSLKDEAHYGTIGVSGSQLKSALRQAERLIAFADGVMSR